MKKIYQRILIPREKILSLLFEMMMLIGKKSQPKTVLFTGDYALMEAMVKNWEKPFSYWSFGKNAANMQSINPLGVFLDEKSLPAESLFEFLEKKRLNDNARMVFIDHLDHLPEAEADEFLETLSRKLRKKIVIVAYYCRTGDRSVGRNSAEKIIELTAKRGAGGYTDYAYKFVK